MTPRSHARSSGWLLGSDLTTTPGFEKAPDPEGTQLQWMAESQGSLLGPTSDQVKARVLELMGAPSMWPTAGWGDRLSPFRWGGCQGVRSQCFHVSAGYVPPTSP